MGFWVFMLIVDLLIPITMIIIGKHFMKTAPQEINAVFGYRTSMSMKNIETWCFAHHYCGKLWQRCGLLLFPFSLLIMGCVIGQSNDTIGIVGGILCFIQLIPMIGCIFPTEKALKKNFNSEGLKKCNGDE